MGLTLVSGPSMEPVTLGEVKDHLRVETTEDDGLIAGYILAARAWSEDFTRRAFVTQTWDYSMDYEWPYCRNSARGVERFRIVLPKPPLQSVTFVTYVDGNGVTQTLAADQYQVNNKSHEGLIEPAYGVIWPSVREQMNAITVRLVAGYGAIGDVPQQVRQAMFLLIGNWYENREEVVVGSAVNSLPMGVEALLGPLRIFY